MSGAGTRARPPLGPLTGTLLAGVVCAVVSAALAGPGGALSAVLATALAAAFFASGGVSLRVAGLSAGSQAAGLGILLLTFTLRLALVLIVLSLAARTDVLVAPAIGFTILACAAVWPLLQLRRTLATR